MNIGESTPIMVYATVAGDTHQKRGELAGCSLPRISTLALNTIPATIACLGFVSGVYMRDDNEVTAYAIASVFATMTSGLFAFYSAGLLRMRNAEDLNLRLAGGATGLLCACAGVAQALWIARVPFLGKVPPDV